ncbi:MAG: CPBP family intramembrane metalloprotease [Clostridia bacterium]|nr:CPBP family intramembrane metalloprotease [Clostridia bacterium]
MSNPKGNTLPNAISIYFVMLAVYCIDIFLFKSDLTVLGDAFYSRFISFAVLVLYIWASKDSAKILGVSKKKEKFTAGVLYGVIFSVIPLFLVTAAECVYYGLTDLTAIKLNFSPPSLNYVRSEENLTPVIAVAIYAFTTFFASAFKEFFFRGFLLKKLKKVMDFSRANILQSVLYMSFTMALLLRNLINGYYDETTTRLGVFIITFYIIHETLAGIKWGLMTRVSGSTYIATVDHFLYVFLSNSIFITNRYVTWSFMTHMLAIQVISLLMTLVYYKWSMKKINAKKERKRAREEAELLEIEARRKARKEKSINKKTDGIDEISPQSFKKIVRSSSASSGEFPTEEEILQTNKSIEETLTNPLDDVQENNELDDILRKATREMSGHNHHHSREITDNFDADNFLRAYSKGEDEPKHHSRHNHRHHHRHSEPGKTVKVYTPPVRKEPAKKPKLTFYQKMQSLGGVDDSSSNDLI